MRSRRRSLLLQAVHGGIMIVTEFGEVLPQRAHQPAEHAVGHFDSVQHVGELLEQAVEPSSNGASAP